MRIEPTNSHLYGTFTSFSSAGLAGMICFLLLLSGLMVRLAAQTLAADPIRVLQKDLRVAIEQHASREQVGELWYLLGVGYHKGFELEKAEDAYDHAIHLLRNTALKPQYANSLHSLAEIYVMQSRLKEARSNLTRALEVFEELGDTRSVASVRDTLAVELLRDHKFREAEIEASRVVAALESLDDRELSELENAYTTRARAVAGQGRPEAALLDAMRARSLAVANSAANSIDCIVTLLVQGEIQMQAGLESEARQAMVEALKLARSRTDFPPAMFATLEASILQREAASLRRAHHSQDADILEDQMRHAQSAARAGCNGCTVNVTSLLSR